MSSKFVVKGYKIKSKIDEIESRKIYHALHIKSGKEVFITSIEVKSEEILERLKRRAVQSKKCSFPGLITVINYGVVDEYFYYTHKAIMSKQIIHALENVLDADKRFYNMVRYFMKALEIVEYLHKSKTTHRELSTSQIRIDSRGNVLLDGFINSRPKTEPKSIANAVELPYMSPEQLMGGPANRKTDIYSMGVVFYELVTGVTPYTSNYAKIDDIREGNVPTPSLHNITVHPKVENMIIKALSASDLRYKNARVWLNDLESFYNKRPISVRVKDFTISLKNFFHARV